MQRFFLQRLGLLSSAALLLLASCTNQPQSKFSAQPAESIVARSSNSESLHPTPTETTLPETDVKQAQSADTAEPESPTKPAAENVSTGNLLSPAQVEKLTKLPIPIVAPSYLPQGFQVMSANGDSVKYTNGDDDTGYAIEYQGEDNTCFAIQSSKDGPRGLKQVGQVETALGTVKIYEENYQNKTSSLQSFIPVQGNPVMISPVSRLNQETGNYEACKALDRAEYDRILRSIELVK